MFDRQADIITISVLVTIYGFLANRFIDNLKTKAKTIQISEFHCMFTTLHVTEIQEKQDKFKEIN